MSLCKTCEHPNRREIERQQRAGVPDSILAPATRDMDGGYVSRLALGRHRREHLGVAGKPGRREMAADLATAIRDRTHERLVEGELEPTIRDGLGAQQLLDKRSERDIDRDIWARITIAMSGNRPRPRLEPELDVMEAEYRVLAEGGSAAEATAAKEAREAEYVAAGLLPAGELAD